MHIGCAFNPMPIFPNYVPGPEYPPSPDFIPEPVYLEFMPPEDEVHTAEEPPPASSMPHPLLILHQLCPLSSDPDTQLYCQTSTAVALPAVDHAPSAEETEPFETNESATTPPPHPAYRVTTRISIRDEPPTNHLVRYELRPHLLPFTTGHNINTLPHTRAYTPPSGTPPSGTPPLLPIPLPTSSPSLLLPSADHGADRPEREFGYGIYRPLGDRSGKTMSVPPRLIDTKVVRRMTEFTTRVRQDTNEIYMRLDDENGRDKLMAGRHETCCLWVGRAYARTSLLMEREAGMSREAWGRSMDASDLARSEVMSLRTTVLGQQAMITELQAADHRRQAGRLQSCWQ
ncbi:hypothetical protein Tco_1212838 [Tanacetum coccineum]